MVDDRWGDSREKETRCFLSSALSFPFLFFTLVLLLNAHMHSHTSPLFSCPSLSGWCFPVEPAVMGGLQGSNLFLAEIAGCYPTSSEKSTSGRALSPFLPFSPNLIGHQGGYSHIYICLKEAKDTSLIRSCLYCNVQASPLSNHCYTDRALGTHKRHRIHSLV